MLGAGQVRIQSCTISRELVTASSLSFCALIEAILYLDLIVV